MFIIVILYLVHVIGAILWEIWRYSVKDFIFMLLLVTVIVGACYYPITAANKSVLTIDKALEREYIR